MACINERLVATVGLIVGSFEWSQEIRRGRRSSVGQALIGLRKQCTQQRGNRGLINRLPNDLTVFQFRRDHDGVVVTRHEHDRATVHHEDFRNWKTQAANDIDVKKGSIKPIVLGDLQTVGNCGWRERYVTSKLFKRGLERSRSEEIVFDNENMWPCRRWCFWFQRHEHSPRVA